MFYKETIKRLQQQIDGQKLEHERMRERIWVLENPFKCKVGQKVKFIAPVCNTKHNGVVVERHVAKNGFFSLFGVLEKKYRVLVGDVVVTVYESNIQ